MLKKIIRKIMKMMWELLPMSNTIVFESLDDLDGNSGAVFNYMIENGYNQKYKMIWLIKNQESLKKLKNRHIKNVTFYHMYNYTYWQIFRLGNAKYLFYDNEPIRKYRRKQKEIYLSHGFPGIKYPKGLINIDDYADYAICTSENMEDQAVKAYNTIKEKLFICGLPRNDELFKESSELTKITCGKNYKKVVIWMPTFRKFFKGDRNDSEKDFKLGIPLLESEEQFIELNNKLTELETMLILKIHPGQDLSVLKLKDFSNIKILLPDEMKKKDINLYKLLGETDALVTDYSSVYFDYLLIDKPICFVIDDIKEYKFEFMYENVLEWMAGEKVYTLNEFEEFFENLSNDKDEFKLQREKIRNISHKYQDGKNCERIIEFIMNLK